jgi:hypothetical protein
VPSGQQQGQHGSVQQPGQQSMPGGQQHGMEASAINGMPCAAVRAAPDLIEAALAIAGIVVVVAPAACASPAKPTAAVRAVPARTAARARGRMRMVIPSFLVSFHDLMSQSAHASTLRNS